MCVCLCLCESKVNVTREHSIACMTTIFSDGIVWVYYGTGVQKKGCVRRVGKCGVRN